MRRLVWMVLILVGGLLPRGATALPGVPGWSQLLAQPSGAVPTVLSRLADAHPGDWAEYVVRVGDHPVGPWLRLLVVGPAEGGGTWMEIWISQRPGSATQAFRVAMDGEGRVQRVIGRLLGGPSRDLPLESLTEGEATAGALSFTTHGSEAIPTAAGTVRATRVEARSSGERALRAWLSEAIPVLGLVRLDLASGAGLELVAHGRGGKGVVTPPAPPAADAQR